MASALELVTLLTFLDIVERMIGPSSLLYNFTYIITESNVPDHVS